MPGNSDTIGLVGLGLVGQALAGRLLADGCRLVGHDPAPAARESAAALGVDVLDNPAEVGRRARLVILSLPASPVVDAVLWGPDGLGPSLAAGCTVIDTTTADPAQTIHHGTRLARQGCRFVDCGLVGSSAEIAAGQALGLLGAAEGQVPFAPILERAIGRLFFLGGCGQGHRAKLVVNLVIGLNRLVLAEGLGLARGCGMDAAATLEILSAGASYSAVMRSKGSKMLERRYEPPVARLAQHAKDVALILELGRQVDARLPLSGLHDGLLREAVERGLGQLDNAAVAELFLRGEG